VPSGRAARPEAASSVAPVPTGYARSGERSSSHTLGTTNAPRRRATFHQPLLATAALSLLGAALLAAWTLLGIDLQVVLGIAALAAAAGLVALALALVSGWPAPIPWAVVSLGASYAVSLHGQQAIDGRAPVVGGLLVLVAELAYWSLERRTPVGDEAGLHLRRAVSVLATTLGATAVAAALLAVTSLPLGGSVTWDAFGLAAAAGAVATLALLSQRTSSSLN
jgi:hypothetical protein